MFCGDETLIGISNTGVCLVPLKCKCWTCDECMPQRLMKLRRLAANGEPTTFITLTINPARYHDAGAAAKELVSAWRMVRQRARREGLAHKIPFLAVLEDTKRGWPHLHILCRAPYLPQQWLSQAASDYLGAPIVDIRRVYNRRHASRYIAKYVSKGPALFAGCKRYWRSQDYAGQLEQSRPVADANTRWHRSLECLATLEYLLQNCDWHHSNEPGDDRYWYPGPEARWLWVAHSPPAQMEIPSCTYRH